MRECYKQMDEITQHMKGMHTMLHNKNPNWLTENLQSVLMNV